MSEQLENGHKTLISFAADTGILLDNIDLQPPGIDGGDKIDVTTMSNDEYMTFVGKSLKTLTDAQFSAAYDPAVYDEVIAILQVNNLITVTFPDLSTLAFWGFIDSFTPSSLVGQERPTADVVVKVSNRNASKVETGPVYAAAP